jgi:hypothetical protein
LIMVPVFKFCLMSLIQLKDGNHYQILKFIINRHILEGKIIDL